MKKAIIIAPLTAKEKMRFEICSDKVLKSLDAQFEGGLALIEIRDHKLYREEFKTFEAYCEAVLKISKRRAYQLIDAAEVKESLPPKASAQIVNESQARALVDVPENMRAAVIAEAAKDGPVTGASLEAAAAKKCTIVHAVQPVESGVSTETPSKNGKSKPKPVLDSTGWAIPAEILPLWQRIPELQAIMAKVSEVRCALRDALGEDDALFRGIPNTILDELNGIYYQLGNQKPHAVCTTCQGHPKMNGSCEFCHSTGFISKRYYQTAVPTEIRAIREKQIARAAA